MNLISHYFKYKYATSRNLGHTTNVHSYPNKSTDEGMNNTISVIEDYKSNSDLNSKKESISPNYPFQSSNFYIKVSLIGAFRAGLSLVIEHPLESIKTQWQDKNNISSNKEIVSSIYREKGLIGYYRGFIPNLIRVAFKNFYRWPMMLYFPHFFDRSIPDRLVHLFPGLTKILTGLVIANIETFIICPLDRLKVFFMTSSTKSQNLFKNFYNYHKGNLIRELFRGLGVSFWRSNVSWVSFLYLDHKLKRSLKIFHKSEILSNLDLFIISVIVGMGNLAMVMPFDFVKTQMQKEGCILKINTLSAIFYYYKNFGLKILFTGWQFRTLQYVTQSIFTVFTLEMLENKSKSLEKF